METRDRRSAGVATVSFLTILLSIPGSALPVAGRDEPQALPELPRLALGSFSPDVRAGIEKAYDAARANPQDPFANGKLGMAIEPHGLFEEAAVCYGRAHRLDPASFRWAYFLGLVLAAEGKFDEAAVVLRQGLVLLPEYLPAQLKLGECLLGGGKGEEAGAIYEGILERHGDSAEAHYGLGRVKAARKELEGAAESLRKACEIFPYYGAAHYALALVYRDQGKTELSREELALFEKHKTATPRTADPLRDEVRPLGQNTEVPVALGAEMGRQGRWKEAVAAYEQALEINPETIEAHVNLIMIYGRLGNLPKAEEHYRAAAQLHPDYPEIHFNYAMVLAEGGRYAEAEVGFRKALEINPFHPEAHNFLGDVLQRQARLAEAVGEFRKAIENRPSFAQAHFNLGRILVNEKSYREGIEHFLRGLEAADEASKATYLYAVGAAYARARDRSNSLRYLRLARERAAALHQDKLLTIVEQDLRTLEGDTSSR